MTIQALVSMLGLIGLVIVIAALLSGFIERSNFPQVAVFLGLGALLGPWGLSLVDIGLDSPLLMAVATISLSLVLFTDALTLNIPEVKRHAGLAGIILGPGTIAAAAMIAVAGAITLGLAPAPAIILGAALASTDPVLLRGFLRRPDLPATARQALRLESGLNDVVLLPIVLVGMALVAAGTEDAPSMGRIALNMLVIGPGAGILVAWIGIASMDLMRRKVGVRRDYESLYSLGIALGAYALGEALHGSGFLAAFAAGLTIAALDVELCDCFREYGETTAEMMLLFTFVLLGVSLMWTGLALITWAAVAFALLALLARPLSLLVALTPTKLDRRSVRIITWFGPRGLSSLLLILVPVFSGTRGSDLLFQICALVVLVSVAFHGASIMLFGRAEAMNDRRRARAEGPHGVAPVHEDVRMEIEDLKRLMESGEPVVLLDVRSHTSFLQSEDEIKDSVRIDPDQARRSASLAGVPKEAWAALFCT